MNSFIAIILFFSIHIIEIGHFMETNRVVGEVGESSSSSSSRRNVGGHQQSSSGIIQQQKSGWEKIIEEKTNSHNDPPIEELAAILALFDWLANYGNEIFDGKDENIVEKPDEIFNKIIGGDLGHRITHQVVLNFKEFIPENEHTEPKILSQEQKKIFKKIKNPNTRTMLFEKMLLGAMNEVKIPQSEIDASLNTEHEEMVKKRRIEHKFKFQFGFMVDCIYANYYQPELDKVNYRKILELLLTKNVDECRQILLHNNCADMQTVDVFIKSIMSTNLNEHNFGYLETAIDEFFEEKILNKFINSMLKHNDLEEKENSILKMDPYFPEELPKIANLGALANLLIYIIYSIIDLTNPMEIFYAETSEWLKMSEILKKTIRYMTNIGNLMHFIVVKQGKHYKMAMNNINNPNLQMKLAKMGSKHSIFAWIFCDILYYDKWFRKLKLYMAKYVAEDYFGLNLNIRQRLNNDTKFSNYFTPIVKQISQHIIQKYLNALRNEEDDQNLDANQNEIEEKKKKKALFEFLNLRIFCVGIRQKINMKEEQQLVAKNTVFKELYKKLDLELLEIIPRKKAIFEHEIMPELETDTQIVDPDKLFTEALTKIKDKICRK